MADTQNIFNVEEFSVADAQKVNDDLFGTSFGDSSDITPIPKGKEASTPAPTPPGKKPVKKEEPTAGDDGKNKDPEDDGSDAIGKFFQPKDEKPEEVEESGDEDEDEEEEEEGVAPASQFETLSKELYNLNIFRPDMDEEGNETQKIAKTPEEFKNLFETQSNNKGVAWINNFLSKHGDDRRELFDAIFINGVEPGEYLPTYNQVQSLKEVSLEDPAAQEQIVREFWRRANYPDDKINKKIQMLKDTAYLQSEAEDLHPQLIEQDEQNLRDQEERARTKQLTEQRADVEYRSSLSKVLTEKLKTKEFDGIPLNEKDANEVFDYLYTKKYKTPDNRLLTEFDKWVAELNRPENHALKVKVGLLARKNFDLTKVQQKAISKESGTLFSTLTQQTVKKSNKQKPSTDSWSTVLK